MKKFGWQPPFFCGIMNPNPFERNGFVGKLGFGCMRLPMIGGPEGQVDQQQFNTMVDKYMAAGFRYFDTAHVYLAGQSEIALREGLVKRYPRDSFFLVDKLSSSQFQSEAEIRPFLQKQMDYCGVDYFDLYLMHSQSAEVYQKFMSCNAYETAKKLKEEGKIKHWGISFHDKPAVLEQILTDWPEIEVVQIQLNYLDYDDPGIEAGGVYQVCEKFGKPVLVMEPVRGGALADLPPEGKEVFAALGDASPASYALRYAAGFKNVVMVLSGMSDTAQMEDNLRTFRNLKPLNRQELSAIDEVRRIIRSSDIISCTACRYCTAGCPKQISIPDLFSCYNTKKKYQDWGSDFYYDVYIEGRGKPSDCIGCGKCEKICPQHLPIRELLWDVAATFEEAETDF